MSETLQLTKALIERRSITPDDAGCQALLGARLAALGFYLESVRRGKVDNLWARLGEADPLFVFAGHTDVVPPGPAEHWDSAPFEPTEKGGFLYGRGAADMKASLAAMITATERFLADGRRPQGSIAFLLTSDEEGEAVDGTARVIEWLQERGETIDWCLVGEPSSSDALADVIKHGRRGSLSGRLRVIGRQGHVAYPQLADNPVHRAGAALAELCAHTWDHGNAHFPPTSFQISNIHAGTGAGNVIPGTLDIDFNFRYSTETDDAQLARAVESLLDRHELNYQLDWSLSGRPFLTEPGRLVQAVQDAVTRVTGRAPALSTAGGTSDGRFIAPTGAQVIELGPVNKTIHQTNECVRIDDLEPLSAIYRTTLENLIG